jgi:deoxyribose-phosphate aldolase
MPELKSIAQRALPLLDLTNLNEDCDERAIDRLCARAATPHGSVAALCIYPQWIRRAIAMRPSAKIRIATVANFPAGGNDSRSAAKTTLQGFAQGADEVDVVLPWRAMLSGDHKTPAELVRACRACVPPNGTLKAILETGELRSPAAIALASRIALGEGAHFIKTSTGKVPVNATPEAASVMLAAIRDSGGPAGFKAAGGIRTVTDAKIYLQLADQIMGPKWASPRTFRFGASSLLDNLFAILDGTLHSDRPGIY